METKCIRCSRPRIENLKICTECQKRAFERATKNKHQCNWITETDEQCSIRTDKSLNYCKRHNKYEEIVKVEDVLKLKKCSCCRDRKLDDDFKRNNDIFNTCNDCEIIRQKNVAKKQLTRIKCSVDNCRNNIINNNQYCLLHINFIVKDDTMCSNRSCYELIEDVYKQCAKCRADERSKSNTINNRLNYYKKNCNQENKLWNLMDEDAKKLFLEKCHYCGKNASILNLNGIDRKMPKEPYNLENCVSCCEICNFMKKSLEYNIFIKIINHLAMKNNFNDNLEDTYHELFNFPEEINYNKYYNGARTRKILFTITDTQFNNIINNDCYYCKSIPEKFSGIDRLDNNEGYNIDNCIPCCSTCNILKHTLSYNDFIKQIERIYNNLNNITSNNSILDDIEQKLIELYTEGNSSINPYQEKFNYEDEYYLKMLFDGKINDVSKIKLKLEFVENYHQRDIWNFYRARLSSFRKNVENTKNNIGRRIFILVKDDTSNKYLGILGISSDYASITGRDNYIGWTNEMKFEEKLLNKLFNITMCVPSTVFGYNFCGGKLLTKLCFSKEVIQYYYDKYQDIPLAITTMSIYGKGVQYENLKEIKFIGYSAGKGLKSFSPEVLDLSKQYLILKGFDINDMSNKTQLTAKIISKTISLLGLNRDEYMYHRINRGVYFGELFTDSLKMLKKEVDINIKESNINNLKSINDLYNEWLNKYANKRYYNLLSQTKLIKINKFLWSKQYKIFERNKKYVSHI
jgi:hypothetical protein